MAGTRRRGRWARFAVHGPGEWLAAGAAGWTAFWAWAYWFWPTEMTCTTSAADTICRATSVAGSLGPDAPVAVPVLIAGALLFAAVPWYGRHRPVVPAAWGAFVVVGYVVTFGIGLYILPAALAAIGAGLWPRRVRPG